MSDKEKVYYNKGSEALALAAKRGGGCPVLVTLEVRLDGVLHT